MNKIEITIVCKDDCERFTFETMESNSSITKQLESTLIKQQNITFYDKNDDEYAIFTYNFLKDKAIYVKQVCNYE